MSRIADAEGIAVVTGRAQRLQRGLPRRRPRRAGSRQDVEHAGEELAVRLRCRPRPGCARRRPRGRRPRRRRRSSAPGSCRSNLAVNQKVDPAPGSLSTPISPAHQLDQALGDGQAEAGAAEAAGRGGVGLRERLEQRVGLLRRECRCRCRAPRTAASPRRPTPRPARRVTATSPRSVNLTALPSRLMSTWRSRPGSPRSADGTSGSTSAVSSRPLACGLQRRAGRRCPRRSLRRSKSRISSSSLPASILEKSRMSLMIVSSASALFCTVSA